MDSTAKPPKPIETRQTVTEMKKGYFIVNPKRRQFFPAEGVPFEVGTDDESFKTTIEVIRSMDEGLRDPHGHYHIHLPQIMEMPKGVIISLNRVPTNEYELTMINR